MPFYSQTEQKKNKGVSGYQAKTSGGVVGFDTKANDSLTIGVAGTYVQSDVKMKDISAGNKNKVEVMMFSVYGLQEFNNNLFVQAIASFGSGKVKTKSKMIETNAQNTEIVKVNASGKYDTMTYGTEVMGGYNFQVAEGAVLTPMLGLAYNRFNDSGYTEKGTRLSNRTFAKKSNDKLEGIIGAKASMTTDVSGVSVTPEAHGFARIAFNNKAPKTDVRLGSFTSPLSVKSNKGPSSFYNIGTSLNAKSGMMEYAVGYDATLATKYVAHQGTLKVRVNF
jgi:outer membrane autotransporter protein